MKRTNILRRLGTLMATLLFAAFIFAPSAGFAQNLKVGYVNLQRAINEVDEGKKAKAKLKRDFKKKQQSLDKLQSELKKMKKEFDDKTMMLSDKAKREKAAMFQRKMYELQQTYMKLQGELAKAEAKATKKIFDRMGKIIKQIAKEKKYDLVLERTESAILYAKDDMDLTSELVKRFNAGK